VLLIRSFIACFFILPHECSSRERPGEIDAKNSFDTFVDIYLHGVLKRHHDLRLGSIIRKEFIQSCATRARWQSSL